MMARRLQRHPTLVILRQALQRIPFQPLDVNCLNVLEYMGVPPRDAQHERVRAEVRSATPQDLDGLTSCQHSPATFLKRFAADDRCVVAIVDGRIAGYEWFCHRPCHVEERYAYRIDVAPDAIYAYDAFIRPEYRLMGIWLKFKSVYLRELMERSDKRRIITTIDSGNRLSMQTHLRFGFRALRKVLVVKACGRCVAHATTVPQDAGWTN